MEYVKEIRLYQIEPLELGTGIDWWDENRKAINVAINEFNKYQLGQSDYGKNMIIALIKDIEEYGSKGYNEFSGWQFDLLNEMLEVL